MFVDRHNQNRFVCCGIRLQNTRWWILINSSVHSCWTTWTLKEITSTLQNATKCIPNYTASYSINKNLETSSNLGRNIFSTNCKLSFAFGGQKCQFAELSLFQVLLNFHAHTLKPHSKVNSYLLTYLLTYLQQQSPS